MRWCAFIHKVLFNDRSSTYCRCCDYAADRCGGRRFRRARLEADDFAGHAGGVANGCAVSTGAWPGHVAYCCSERTLWFCAAWPGGQRDVPGCLDFQRQPVCAGADGREVAAAITPIGWAAFLVAWSLVEVEAYRAGS